MYLVSAPAAQNCGENSALPGVGVVDLSGDPSLRYKNKLLISDCTPASSSLCSPALFMAEIDHLAVALAPAVGQLAC